MAPLSHIALFVQQFYFCVEIFAAGDLFLAIDVLRMRRRSEGFVQNYSEYTAI